VHSIRESGSEHFGQHLQWSLLIFGFLFLWSALLLSVVKHFIRWLSVALLSIYTLTRIFGTEDWGVALWLHVFKRSSFSLLLLVACKGHHSARGTGEGGEV
jgi:hypothetical protein